MEKNIRKVLTENTGLTKTLLTKFVSVKPYKTAIFGKMTQRYAYRFHDEMTPKVADGKGKTSKNRIFWGDKKFSHWLIIKSITFLTDIQEH